MCSKRFLKYRTLFFFAQRFQLTVKKQIYFRINCHTKVVPSRRRNLWKEHGSERIGGTSDWGIKWHRTGHRRTTVQDRCQGETRRH
jgi:hypothetical protein